MILRSTWGHQLLFLIVFWLLSGTAPTVNSWGSTSFSRWLSQVQTYNLQQLKFLTRKFVWCKWPSSLEQAVDPEWWLLPFESYWVPLQQCLRWIYELEHNIDFPLLTIYQLFCFLCWLCIDFWAENKSQVTLTHRPTQRDIRHLDAFAPG